MHLCDFLISELQTTTLFLSEKGERTGLGFVVVFLPSLLTELLVLTVCSMRPQWESETGGKLHSMALISCCGQTRGLGDFMRHNMRIFYFTFYHFFILAWELDKVLLLSVKSKPASACYHSVTLPSVECINSQDTCSIWKRTQQRYRGKSIPKELRICPI